MADHFVRILTAEQANASAQLLIDQFNPRVERSDSLLSIFAPDGDIAFQALKKDDNTFICRFHKEVFQQ